MKTCHYISDLLIKNIILYYFSLFEQDGDGSFEDEAKKGQSK